LGGAACVRIATFGILTEKPSGNKLVVINTHYDHESSQAREESSKLILRKLDEFGLSDERVILMGDLNSFPRNDAIAILEEELSDSYDSCQTDRKGPTGTFNGFKKWLLFPRRIDYIFTKNLKVISYQIDDSKMVNGDFISDHYPIVVEVE
jgi:endonuclease/exonuclease/phosphatase family metal-dependent hydrolase